MSQTDAISSPAFSGWRSRLRLILSAGWIDREPAQRRFDDQFRKDRLGHALQVGLTRFMCIVACLPASFMHTGIALFFIYWVIRLTRTWRTAFLPAAMPLFMAIALFAAWQALSLAWSLDPAHGRNEFYKLRWFVFMFIIWTVMDRRELFIKWLAAGLFLGNLAQVAQAIGRRLGHENVLEFFTGGNIEWMLDHDRTGGWWHPLAAGTMLLAALGLHLPAAVMGQGKARAFALAGVAASVLGIVATGTRGAILAAAVLIPLILVFALLRQGLSRVTLAWTAGVVAAIACVAFAALGDRVVRRADMAMREINAAVSRGEYKSSDGARVQMAIWSLEALRQRPITGVGAGAFQEFSRRQVVAAGKVPDEKFLFEHAHNSLLHIAATTGIIGAGLALLVVLTSLWSAFAPLTPAQHGTYAAGPGWALAGMYLVSMTDPIHFNTQTSILLFMLFALCPIWVPSSRPKAPA